MSDASTNKEVLSRFYEDVFIRHDLSHVDEYMRDDYIQHNPDCPQGKAGFLEFFTTIFAAVPDFSYTLKKMVAEGDTVVTYSTTTGTHTGGEWIGRTATGNSLNFDVVDIFRMQDGKIAEHWDVADTFTFFGQLGHLKDRNKRVVRDFYEAVFVNHDLGAVDRFMHDDYIQHNADCPQGKAGFIEFHRGFFAAVPDFRATINMMVAEDDKVFVYNTVTGTHTGHGFLGYPPTNNQIRFDTVDMYRLRDGKLCEHWDVADTRALFTQVGALPGGGAAST